MSAVQMVNQNADVIGQKHALIMNINAAKSLQKVLETNLGPKGTMKMSVVTVASPVVALLVLMSGSSSDIPKSIVFLLVCWLRNSLSCFTYSPIP